MTITLSRLHLFALSLMVAAAAGYYIFVYERTPVDFLVCNHVGGTAY
jgi:hypothetical protein